MMYKRVIDQTKKNVPLRKIDDILWLGRKRERKDNQRQRGNWAEARTQNTRKRQH